MMVNLSILNSPKDNLKEYYSKFQMLPILHMDIMDGKFVPNTSFDERVVKESYLASPRSVIDVHLMVTDPENYFLKYKEAGADFITFHYETGKTDERIDMIHSLGLKAGLAINPETDVHVLDKYLDKLDLVLVMSVNPGAGGQAFIESSVDKVKHLKEYKTKNNLHYLISIDGGINMVTGQKIKPYCDLCVVGSAITKAEDYAKAYVEHFMALL